MTIAIVVPDSSFTKYTRSLGLLRRSIAKSYYLIGGTLDASDDNLAGASAGAMTPVGAPAFSTGYATVGQNNGFNLGYINDWPFTYVAVARYHANLGFVVGHWAAPNAGKDAVYYNGPNQLQLAIDGAPRVALNGVPSGFVFIAATYDGTTARLFAHDGSTLLNASAAFSAANHPNGNIRCGASAASSLNSNVDIAAVAAWQTVLPQADLAEMHPYLKTVMGTRGISVA